MSMYDDFEPYPFDIYPDMHSDIKVDYWTTKEGKKLKFVNMTDQHLMNIINLFGYSKLPPKMKNEIMKRALK